MSERIVRDEDGADDMLTPKRPAQTRATPAREVQIERRPGEDDTAGHIQFMPGEIGAAGAPILAGPCTPGETFKNPWGPRT